MLEIGLWQFCYNYLFRLYTLRSYLQVLPNKGPKDGPFYANPKRQKHSTIPDTLLS